MTEEFFTKNVAKIVTKLSIIGYGVMIGYYNHEPINKIKTTIQDRICQTIENKKDKKEPEKNIPKYKTFEEINTPENTLEYLVNIKYQEDLQE